MANDEQSVADGMSPLCHEKGIGLFLSGRHCNDRMIYVSVRRRRNWHDY